MSAQTLRKTTLAASLPTLCAVCALALLALQVTGCSAAPAPETQATAPHHGTSFTAVVGHETRSPKPFDQPSEARQFWAQQRAPIGSDSVPIERYEIAKQTMDRMPRYSTHLGLKLPSAEQQRHAGAEEGIVTGWESLGPGNIGGRTRRLVIDPTDTDIMYAGGVDGGVWKTIDGGASWTPMSDLIANIAVSSLVMDPADPNTLYAGTGEGFFNSDSVRGNGIFKSTDGGATWTHLAATANNSNFHYVNDLIVSSNSSTRVYAATRNGVFRSTDSGVTWSQVHNPGTTGGCTDLDMRTDLPQDTVFVACGNFAQASIYRNTDAGGAGTWTSVFSEAGMGRTTLAIAPSNEATIYALTASIVGGPGGNFNNGLHAVFRSTDGGGTWAARVRNSDPTPLNTLLLSNSPVGICNGQFFNQGWYDNIIAVDPVDPDVVWAGGVDLMRSDDGGANWGIASLWWVAPTETEFVHADQHDIVFDPNYDGSTNKRMFATNDGGVFRIDDSSAAVGTGADVCNSVNNIMTTWTSLNNDYAVTQFYHGLPYPDGATYFGGTQDNGTDRGTDGGGLNGWAMIQGGDGGYVAVDPTNTNVLYAEFTGLSMTKSVNGGATFAGSTTGIADSGLFISPFTMDPSNSQRLWYGGGFAWRTDNAAASWVRANNGLSGTFSAVAVAPTNSNRVLVGTSTGFIHRTSTATTDDSTSIWPSTQPRSGFVSWIGFDPTDDMIAYATYTTFGGNHVWKTTDGGASWTAIDGSGAGQLPDLPAHSILVDPSDTDRLLLGTDLGLFVSTDGGDSWAVDNTGFANVVIESMSIITPPGSDPTLYVFTHGRGAWRVLALGNEIFTDGFESGNVSAWSLQVP